MQIVNQCPTCENIVYSEVTEQSDLIRCARCHWSRAINQVDIDQGQPTRCLACGCDDLWRQKDFSQKLGLSIVGLGVLLSTTAWAFYLPEVAIGVLMAFALVDLALYALMKDVLVCYRCRARHRRANLDAGGPEHFDLETAERYRQEAKRLEDSAKPNA